MHHLRSLLPALVLVAVLATGCGNDTSPSGPPASANRISIGPEGSTSEIVDQPGPLLTYGAFDLSEYEGDVVLLNFWATWCAPCRAEMPDLAQLQKQLGPEGLQILGVATDRRGREVVAPYLEQNPINYPIFLDPDQKIGAPYGGMAALPTTLLIGRDGEVRQRIVGRVRMEPLRQRLEALLADRQESSPGTAPADGAAGTSS